MSGLRIPFVLVAFLLLATSLICSLRLTKALARRVLNRQGQGRIPWRVSAWMASFTPTSAVLLALALLVVFTMSKDVPAGGVGLVLAVAVGVVGSNVDRQFSGGWANYWIQIHDSIRDVTPQREHSAGEIPDCQRTRFNTSHNRLFRRDERDDTLTYILEGLKCTDSRSCQAHGGLAPLGRGQIKSARRALAAAALVIGVASLVAAVSFVLLPFAVMGGILGVALGIFALAGGGPSGARRMGSPIAGITCSILALAIGIVLSVRIGTWAVRDVSALSRLDKCIAQAEDRSEASKCISRFAVDARS
jgi:hypothetical protein